MTDAPWAVDDLPLLGEVFAVELANSRYRSAGVDLDFLADPAGLAMWFRHARCAADVPVPRHLTVDAVAAVRRVRDATRLLLAETDDMRSPAAAAAAEDLHSANRRAAAHLALETGNGKSLTWRWHFDGVGADTFIADVAARCIFFLGGDDAPKVRRCARPACPMLFVQRHRARQFCHSSCAHSLRQARYYQSTRRQRHGEDDRS